jgi:hypothetical protein
VRGTTRRGGSSDDDGKKEDSSLSGGGSGMAGKNVGAIWWFIFGPPGNCPDSRRPVPDVYSAPEARESPDHSIGSLAIPPRGVTATPGRATSSSLDELIAVVYIEGCRGVQVGDGGRQENRYTFRIDRPKINLLDLLQETGVLKRLALLAANPTDRGLRAEIVDALRGSSWTLLPDEYQLQSGEFRDGAGWCGTLFCAQGVQIGDNNNQRNMFTYVGGPVLDAGALLGRNKELRGSLVDFFSGIAEGSAHLEESLKDVLGHLEVEGIGKVRGIHATNLMNQTSFSNVDGLCIGFGSCSSSDQVKWTSGSVKGLMKQLKDMRTGSVATAGSRTGPIPRARGSEATSSAPIGWRNQSRDPRTKPRNGRQLPGSGMSR